MAVLKTFVIRDEAIKARCAAWIAKEAPADSVVKVSEPGKTRLQEERYHAMISDIAQQWEFCGRKWDAESMKRLLVDQFRRDTIKDMADSWAGMGAVDMAPSIDRTGVVALGVQTRRFDRKLASAFVEWLHAFGAEQGVVWSEAKA